MTSACASGFSKDRLDLETVTFDQGLSTLRGQPTSIAVSTVTIRSECSVAIVSDVTLLPKKQTRSEIWVGGGDVGLRLRLMPLTGGTPRNFLSEETANLAWSPDGERLLSVVRSSQTRIDTDRLKRERPDIAAEYSTTTTRAPYLLAPRAKKSTKEAATNAA